MNTTSNLKAINQSSLLRKIAHIGQRALCESMNKDKSNMSRVVSDEQGMRVSEFCEMLAACGLKVVEYAPETMTIPVEEYEALIVMANKGTTAMRSALPSRGDFVMPAACAAEVSNVYELPPSLRLQAG